jgi:hypothetical protein
VDQEEPGARPSAARPVRDGRGGDAGPLGRATAQFFGALQANVQIEAAREMARVKGGDVRDIARLRTGEFYVALEGEAPRRLRTPLCLSHHPASPLTTEEVMARARP